MFLIEKCCCCRNYWLDFVFSALQHHVLSELLSSNNSCAAGCYPLKVEHTFSTFPVCICRYRGIHSLQMMYPSTFPKYFCALNLSTLFVCDCLRSRLTKIDVQWCATECEGYTTIMLVCLYSSQAYHTNICYSFYHGNGCNHFARLIDFDNCELTFT